MSTTDPLTLQLPSWLCESFDPARVREDGARTAQQPVAVSNETAQVVRRLHRDRHVVAACRSPRVRDGAQDGRAAVIGGARLQCAQYCFAVDELVAREILEDGSPVQLLYGDSAAVLTHLGG